MAKTSLGIGFDPAAIKAESGFKPIVEGQGSSIPTLAFSVLDGADRPPVRPTLYEQDLMKRRQDVQDLYQYEVPNTYVKTVLLLFKAQILSKDGELEICKYFG